MNKYIALTACLLAGSANAGVITFDAAINTTVAGFNTQGFDFEVLTNHYHLEANHTRYGTDSPTTSLVIDDNEGDNSLLLATANGAFFDLLSFDITSAANFWGSTRVDVQGILSNGGLVNYTFNDSNSAPFENIVLGWTNLASVTFKGLGNGGSNGDHFRLDNINVTAAVPEPAPLALLALGLIGLGLFRKKAA